jgi:Zn-dependent protease
MFNILSSGINNKTIIELLAFVIAIVFALSIHEYAHAYLATKQGDLTPKAYGRLTLNPKAHIDPIGFLMLLIVGFGWAKPVPVNPNNFKDYKKGMFLVSIAGITVNIILFLVFTALMVLITEGALLNTSTSLGLFFTVLVMYLSMINLVLAIFNLLPIAPLDGFNIVKSVTRYGNSFVRFMEQRGQMILLILLISGVAGNFISNAYYFIANPVINLFTSLFF